MQRRIVMNKSIKRTMGLVLALFVAVSMCVDITGVFAEDEKTPLYFDYDYAENAGDGHTHPATQADKMAQMWKNLKITVTDSNGKSYESPKEFDSKNGYSILRYGGDYVTGEEVTITVDTSGLPDGYHISYCKKFDEDDHIIKRGYNKFTIKYTPNDTNNMITRIQMAKLSVKFDLQGGNISGNKDAIINEVKKDNLVEFPDNPTKENLNFGGWYTKMPQTYKGKPLPTPGKMYFWKSTYKFSDYDRDWMLYNDPKDDPMYDGIFLLRALWNAEVEFDSNGGSTVDNAVVQEGEKVSEPEAPVKKYAEFLGWTMEDGTDYDFSNPVNQNMVLKAKWNDYTMPEGKDIEINVGDKFNPEDGIINKDKLPNGTKIEPKDNIDTNRQGVYDVTLLVTYPNGDVKEVPIKVTVKQKDKEREYVNKPTKSNVITKAPKTGDSSEMMHYVGLTLLAGLTTLLIMRKRKVNN